ncbi:probable NADH2 dehydrogenase (ubiquinone) acyl carrier chain precursor [Rhynchosporium graminicola]|uniref:Acyl carrier protein n=1 Tax=Rhynchosporium graminicola TaxID=2792576 RepID=A0A1E1K7L6_9HELO|nr:probable NADH2 dehydrogenase (ubiquinone) acyl carrier chain precursor [Rhynchosporium commune]
MFRTALLRSARSASRQVAQKSGAIARPASQSFLLSQSRFAPSAFQAVRCYSATAGLDKPEVEGRIVDLLKNFDKVTDPSKLTPTSHFANDLGLDSLDTVEVVMAIEEEFSIEIPDKEADAIHSVDKAVEYILAQPDGQSQLQEHYYEVDTNPNPAH